MSEMNMREYNARLIEEYRANGGKLSGQLANSQILLLTTTGAKTGQERVTPMGYRLDGDRIIVIAADAGADKHPDWYYNLLAHPDVIVELGAERFPARAVIASAAERERLIKANVVPYFPAQQEKTSREIPFVFLDRSTEAGA
ncbi:MAG TPA: nitroreductase family deazaflavin-dependent oxidoreductase [Ktedonobacterales bacterium]|jgi:deazaflavin-dependent oxidoreductase (nitroreductase family)|nr:nitroreductase family deazaflavin-dependent oxidoreductase [Ktedonobacterales bacterium]